MGLNRILQIALMLTAVDQMSGVVKEATSNIDRAFKKVKDGYKDVMRGMAEVYAGKMMYDNTVKPVEDAFKRVQDAAIELKKTMTQDGGKYDKDAYSQLTEAALANSNKLGLAQEGIIKLQDKLVARGIPVNDVIKDLTQSFSEFSAVMVADPAQSGSFGSALLADWKLTAKELPGVLDLIEKAHHRGLGGNGADAIEKIQESMRDAALAYTATNITGQQAATDYLVMSMAFLNRNLESATIGTSFRKLQDLVHEKEKVDKANEILQKYKPGSGMRFDDENGKPLDTKNMLRQFDMLKSLSAQARNEVLQPLTGGKNGIMGDVLKIVAFGGTDAYNDGLATLMHAGNHATFLKEEMEKLSRQQAKSDAEWNNAKVIMGTELLPILIKLTHVIASVAHGIGQFSKHHPMLTKLTFLFVGIAAAVVTLGGAWALMSGAGSIVTGGLAAMFARGSILRALFEVFIPIIWSMVTAVGALMVEFLPLLLIAGLIAGFILICYGLNKVVKETFGSWGGWWNVIKRHWHSGMASITEGFNHFTNYISTGVTKFGSNIASGFSNAWNFIRNGLSNFVGWVFGLGPRFFNAGANIIGNIWSGIKSMINKPIDAVKHMVQKIRNLLPFSPAKEGPLRDIHRIRLIETIAESIKPNALMDKMRSVAGAVFNYAPSAAISTPNAIAGGSGIILNYAPVYNSRGGGFAQDKDDFMLQSRKNAKDLLRLLEEERLRGAMRDFM